MIWSNPWVLRILLAAGLGLLLFLGSLLPGIWSLESGLYEAVLYQLPDQENIPIDVIPGSAKFLLYLAIAAFYAFVFYHPEPTALRVMMALSFCFSLLLVELLVAVFSGLMVPLLFPLLLLSLVTAAQFGIVHWIHIREMEVAIDSRPDLDEIREQMKQGHLKAAMILLKKRQLDEKLLEVGYELGLKLEADKHWASAQNLYQWLARFDPTMGDFAHRMQQQRSDRSTALEEAAKPKRPGNEVPTIGHYQLQRKVARGATAVVYEAVDTRSGTRVALKVLTGRAGHEEDEPAMRQWLHEAEIVSQFDCHNIVRIHDAEMLDGKAFIAMDFIPGYSMSRRLRKKQLLSLEDCLRVSKDMLNALIVAHSHGVIHGDIKPGNIIYDEVNDEYVLTDFGAAYTENRKNGGQIVGTPAYMSPEQLEGKKLDGRSDLFSLAVTIYQLMTGYQPFQGDSLPEIKANILYEEPDLNHLTLPLSLTEVIVKALHKKPYMRFTDAKQMLVAVEYCENFIKPA